MEILKQKLLSPREVAEAGLLSLTKQWALRKNGKLKHLRVGKKIFYRETDINDFLERCEAVSIQDAKTA